MFVEVTQLSTLIPFSTEMWLGVCTGKPVDDMLVMSAFPTLALCPGDGPRPPIPQGGKGLQVAGVYDERTPRPMRLIDVLRPIAFHPTLVDLCEGSINAALMLSQILYWTPRCGPESEGWFYKTQNQWFEELRLTRTQQENAREILRKKGFIEESLRSCSAGTVNHFRARVELIQSEMDRLRETCIGDCRKPANGYAGNLQRNKEQETTTETTLSLLPSEPVRVNVSKSKKSNGKSSDPRHTPFQQKLKKFWEYLNPDLGEYYWTAGDAGQLGQFLRQWPKLTIEEFHEWLLNYSKSDGIIESKKPKEFLPWIHQYAKGPLNEYRRPMEETRAAF